MNYLRGWSVIPQTLLRRERWLIHGKALPLVSRGQEVLPDQPILRFEKEEPVEIMHAAPRLSLPSTGGINLHTVQAATRGDTGPIAHNTIPAGLRGRVVDITHRGGVVIESHAAIIQGVLGVGPQVAGVLTIWQLGNTLHGQQVIPPGALLVVPGPINFQLLRRAVGSGIAGIIASSITIGDLEGFLRTDLIQLIDSRHIEQDQAHLPPLTLLLTEGLGTMTMPTQVINLLSQYEGAVALLSGTTSLRQKLTPELLISLSSQERTKDSDIQPDYALVPGAQVRVNGGEHEGAIGTIDYLFAQEQVFPSGLRARALRLRCIDGSLLSVPTALLERIG